MDTRPWVRKDPGAREMSRRIEIAAFASALIGAFVVAGAATSAMPTEGTRATQPSATCSASEHYRRAKSLAAYKKAMPKRTAAYFKTHKRAKQRAAFVKAQQAELKRLRQRAACSIAGATPPGVPVPPPGTSTVAAPTTSTSDGLPTSPPVSTTKPGATTTTTPVTTSTTTSTTTAASTTTSTTAPTTTSTTSTTNTSTTTTTGSGCAASYPDCCIPPPPPDLNCADVAPHKNFTVLWNVPDPDPHHFDANKDGIGCEG